LSGLLLELGEMMLGELLERGLDALSPHAVFHIRVETAAATARKNAAACEAESRAP
jgi:hypothetical protein